MNRKQLLLEFEEIFKGICCFPSFLSELLKLIQATGLESAILKNLLAKLKVLISDPKSISLQRNDYFEHIEGGVYSMRLHGKGYNIRILYGIDSSNHLLLLLPFYKRDGKQKTDYTLNIPEAKKRLASMKGGQ